MKAIIAAGGRCSLDLLRDIYEKSGDDTVLIGADRGIDHIISAGLSPDIYIGDFDSRSSHDPIPASCKIIKLDPVKDDTDLEAAVMLVIEKLQAISKVIIVGARGTRPDHTMTNIEMLRLLEDAGIEAFMIDEYSRIRVINEDARLRRSDTPFRYLSLIPYYGEARVSLKGLKYSGEDILLRKGRGLGVSNEITGEECLIDLIKGPVILMETSD